MRFDLTFFKYSLLVATLWIAPIVASGQTDQQQSAPVQKKPKIVFSQNMNQSNRELNWSRTYFLSFKKTREAIYLKLAATHCANAIKVLKATQAGFPNTTPFYYKAKNRRYTACGFFQQLQETALRLAPAHHIEDLTNQECDF